mmetsp:Transcript_52600/g.170966  ORF Transcript_52600/g.170966 Transcript_52600/m.170966 type:complete len:336 (+) Transcript_52600:804-1811(+)
MLKGSGLFAAASAKPSKSSEATSEKGAFATKHSITGTMTTDAAPFSINTTTAGAKDFALADGPRSRRARANGCTGEPARASKATAAAMSSGASLLRPCSATAAAAWATLSHPKVQARWTTCKIVDLSAFSNAWPQSWLKAGSCAAAPCNRSNLSSSSALHAAGVPVKLLFFSSRATAHSTRDFTASLRCSKMSGVGFSQTSAGKRSAASTISLTVTCPMGTSVSSAMALTAADRASGNARNNFMRSTSPLSSLMPSSFFACLLAGGSFAAFFSALAFAAAMTWMARNTPDNGSLLSSSPALSTASATSSVLREDRSNWPRRSSTGRSRTSAVVAL